MVGALIDVSITTMKWAVRATVLVLFVTVLVSFLDPLIYDFTWSLYIYIPSALVYAFALYAFHLKDSFYAIAAATVALGLVTVGILIFLVSFLKPWGPVHWGLCVVGPVTAVISISAGIEAKSRQKL